MHAFLRTSTFCLLSLMLAGTAARAQEMLVMPYSCAVIGGEPVLTRSRDNEGHRIFGQREQRAFSACSPANPDMCRQWTVYRFDIDCGGARVPWMSVVAAADTRRGGGAWVEDGHLQLPMPPGWNMEPDDPCADWSEGERRWRGGRLSRYCAERRSQEPPATVEMPAGFAPMLGIDAVFVASNAPRPTAPPIAQAPAPVPPIAQAPAPPKIARVEPLPPPAADAREAPIKGAPAKEPPVKKQLTPRADAPPPIAPPAQAAPSPGTPIAPRIINRIDPAPPGDARVATPHTPTPAPPARPEAAVPVPEAPRETRISPPAPTKEAAPQSQPPSPQPGPQQATAPDREKSISVNLVSAVPSAAAVAVFGVGAFAMLVMAAFAYMRQRERAQSGHAAGHDFASVSLDAHPAHAPSGGARAVVRARPQQVVPRSPPPVPPAEPELPGTPPSWGDAIPQTRDEALQVLGMGVRADSTETAIKKIVDGLRLSWHPDHADSPGDRQLRELRLKQINAAWDIIAGRRVGA